MLKKIKAFGYSLLAAGAVVLIIAFFSMIFPILLGLVAIIIVLGVAYVTYQFSKDEHQEMRKEIMEALKNHDY